MRFFSPGSFAAARAATQVSFVGALPVEETIPL
jgi:hypothetical protein